MYVTRTSTKQERGIIMLTRPLDELEQVKEVIEEHIKNNKTMTLTLDNNTLAFLHDVVWTAHSYHEYLQAMADLSIKPTSEDIHKLESSQDAVEEESESVIYGLIDTIKKQILDK